METSPIVQALERRIFRSVRAAIIYDRSTIKTAEIPRFEHLYNPINVELIPTEKFASSKRELDIIGILGQSALDLSNAFLSDFNCLKIGFYSIETEMSERNRSPKLLTAAITCLGSKSLADSLRTTVYHFYESLTLPSLLNIDLADVESIARGMGLSFNLTGDSSEDIIARLPSQSYVARSALLHFTCARNVTLEEVYRISKAISTRRFAGSFVSENPNGNQIKMYKRIRLKMGLRISPGREINGTNSRISLTGILFGLKSQHFYWTP